MKEFFEKMQAIDRRWIFLFMAVSIIVPYAFNILIVDPATPEVEAVYDLVDSQPPGSKILVPFDFDPPSAQSAFSRRYAGVVGTPSGSRSSPMT